MVLVTDVSVESRPPASRTGVAARVEWIDAARGGAMLLLLIWHAASIPEVLGTAMPPVVETVNDALHLVRMPLLMFLSGLVADRALTRTLGAYYRRKVATLVWPYLLWATLDLLTYEHQPLADPVSWDGTGYLWFLFFVTVHSLVAPLLVRVPPLVVAAACAAGATTLHLRFPDDDLLFYGVFFFAGLAAARSPGAFARLIGSVPAVVVCALAGAAMCVAWAAGTRPNEGYVAPFALAAVLAVVAGVSRIPRFPRAVGAIGRRSIVWYLAHFPLMHLVVVLLSPHDVPWVALFAASLATALAVCPVLVRLADRTPVRYLFTLVRR